MSKIGTLWTRMPTDKRLKEYEGLQRDIETSINDSQERVERLKVQRRECALVITLLKRQLIDEVLTGRD